MIFNGFYKSGKERERLAVQERGDLWWSELVHFLSLTPQELACALLMLFPSSTVLNPQSNAQVKNIICANAETYAWPTHPVVHTLRSF